MSRPSNPPTTPPNGAGRSFRHGQHPHFRLRLVKSIESDLKVRISQENAVLLAHADQNSLRSARSATCQARKRSPDRLTSNVNSALSKQAFAFTEIHSQSERRSGEHGTPGCPRPRAGDARIAHCETLLADGRTPSER